MLKYFKFLILFTLIHHVVSDDCNRTSNDNTERALQRKLLCNYDKIQRPVREHKSCVNVTMKMHLRTIESSYDRSSIDFFEIGSWVELTWKDEYLNWIPYQYEGIEEITLHSSTLWLPDIAVWNSDRTDMLRIDKPCNVLSSGVVTCVEQMKNAAMCSKDYRKWPYDQQNCSIVYGTWLSYREQVDLTVGPTRTEEFMPSKYWRLLSIEANTSSYNRSRPSMRYSFLLKRNAATTIVEYITPIFALLVMTFGSLCLSILSVERIVLMLLNTYLHMHYIHTISYVAPAVGEDVPDAVLYFRDALFMSCFILIHGITMRCIMKRKTPVPQWIIRIIACIDTKPGRIMFHEFDPAVVTSGGLEDGVHLSSDAQQDSANDWKRFALFLNRLFFIFVFVFYACIIMRYLL